MIPDDVIAALGEGELTQDQLRRLIAAEAAELGLSFDEAVDLARYRELPKTALGSDIELLCEMLS